MPLYCEIPENSMRRMRAMAEANQLVEERIVAEAKKAAEKDAKIENDVMSSIPTAVLHKSEDQNLHDEFEFSINKDYSSLDEYEPLKKSMTALSAISFSEFVDEQYGFLSPKSRASRQYTARENFLQASAKLSENAYDRAVEKVKKMPSILNEVLNGEPAETAEIEESFSSSEEETYSPEEMPWRSLLYRSNSKEISDIVTKIENRMSEDSLVIPTTPKKKLNSFRNFSNLTNTAVPSSKYDRASLMALAKDPNVSAEHYKKIAREAFRG